MSIDEFFENKHSPSEFVDFILSEREKRASEKQKAEANMN